MATLLREGCGRVTSSVNESAKAVHFVAAGVMNLALPPAKVSSPRLSFHLGLLAELGRCNVYAML